MLIELLTKKYPGMRQWLTQRLTAVVMAFYIVCLIVYMIALQPNNYADWLAAISPWWVRLATFLFFFACVCMHGLACAMCLKTMCLTKALRGYMQAAVDILVGCLCGYGWALFC